MVETVLDNVAVPLRDVQNAYTQVDPLDVGASYMWATLQSVQVWRNFRQASWRGHPLVSPQITLYLFQNRASKSELDGSSPPLGDGNCEGLGLTDDIRRWHVLSQAEAVLRCGRFRDPIG